MDGRTITVERSQSNKKESSIGFTVHVNNLSFKVDSDDEIRSIFEEKFGEVKSVHLVKKFGKPRGFAFVEFVTEEGMNKAIRQKELQIQDRMAIIKRS